MSKVERGTRLRCLINEYDNMDKGETAVVDRVGDREWIIMVEDNIWDWFRGDSREDVLDYARSLKHEGSEKKISIGRKIDIEVSCSTERVLYSKAVIEVLTERIKEKYGPEFARDFSLSVNDDLLVSLDNKIEQVVEFWLDYEDIENELELENGDKHNLCNYKIVDIEEVK